VSGHPQQPGAGADVDDPPEPRRCMTTSSYFIGRNVPRTFVTSISLVHSLLGSEADPS